MILSVGAFVRVGGLLLLAVVLQVSALSQLTVFEGHADLVVLTVAAIAYYAGSVTGCAAGFTAGLLVDLLTGATMGASSLVLTAVGYGVGRFREVRDPSHGRCLGMAEWSDLLRARGFGLVHTERLPKDMEFEPWVERMSVAAGDVARLRAMLTDGSPALKAFLRPRPENDDLVFTLDEAILIAAKP